jgi:hypothetical protein
VHTELRRNSAPTLVTVEWYSYSESNWKFEDVQVATRRLGELVHLSSVEDRPKSLRILDGLCFVDSGKALGYICRVPPNASSTKQPVSLILLLQRHETDSRGFRPPELGERFSLALSLAESVYSFSLVRWFHKDFNSHNVTFFRDASSPSAILFSHPYVTGFSLSRPDDEKEKSLNKDREHLAIYLHPELRESSPEEPVRYLRKHELYSLGLLLFEIGIWRPIEGVIKDAKSLSARKFAETAADRAKKDLGFYTGSRYRDVVVRCLSFANDNDDDCETSASLDIIYWSVVLELVKCR